MKRNSYEAAEQSRNGYKKLIFLFFVFGIVLLFRTAVLERIIISGNSMFPSFSNGDICLAKKFMVEPERYDIVVAKVERKTVIKRVIGLPGETIELRNGTVYIDGEKICQKYDYYTENGGLINEPYILAENEYFLLGDNRSESYDSRAFGSVNRENICGIIIVKIYPFGEMKLYSR